LLFGHRQGVPSEGQTMATITILDGGMGRELARIGAPFRQPEWSALALMEGPERVVEAHLNFVEAGAQVITTNSYACVPFHIGDEGFALRGRELARLSGELARKAANTARESMQREIRVAGSIPPVFGSYKPELFDKDSAFAIASVLIESLAPNIDHWLVETISSIAEAKTMLAAIREFGDPIVVRPRWVSFTLADSLTDGRARIRSGETVSAAIKALGGEVEALLFNCSQPEVMASALAEASTALGGPGQSAVRLGVYANAFIEVQSAPGQAANETLSVLREDLTPERYAIFAQEWIDAGATIVGGCCGITPQHIHALPSS
jgi:S-methylmethionine-dependent homocysteine/selenocysteine methylase